MLKSIFKIVFSLPLLIVPLTVFVFWAFGMTLLLGWHN